MNLSILIRVLNTEVLLVTVAIVIIISVITVVFIIFSLLLMLVVAAVMLLNKRPATSIGLPVDQLTYIVSGAHLKWTGPGDRLRATDSGEYVARNVVPARMAMRHDGTVYLAIPRFRRGVPFTLGAVEYDPCLSAIEPPISPYPCAAAHRSPQPKPGNWTMVNVVDVYVDDTGVLWALDVGKVNLLDDATIVRPPMVFAFDTDTDEVSCDVYNVLLPSPRVQYTVLCTYGV